MHPKGTRQLSQCLFSLERFQGYLGPKGRIVSFPHVDHFTMPPLVYAGSFFTLLRFLVFGE